MAELEEEVVVPGTKRLKSGCTCIIHMWSNVHDHLAELFIIRRESLVLLFQGHEHLRLGARYWLGAPNGWDTMGRPQVLDHSVGELLHPIFIFPSTSYYMSPENQKRNHCHTRTSRRPAKKLSLDWKKEQVSSILFF